jgi:alpha-D-xyloside xylohydrolase
VFFDLSEDEGDQYNYEDGAFSAIGIQWQDAAKKLTLGARNGQFAGMLDQRAFDIFLHVERDHSHMTAQDSPHQTIHYDGRQVEIYL